ncbi:MAG: hypothetical protein QW611_05070 [Ignisphaera sp.]
MSKGIGDIVAVLIIVSITIVISIVASLIISNLMRHSEPKGSVISIQGVRAIPLTANYNRLLIEVIATVHGASAVSFVSSRAYDPNGSLLTCTLNSPSINRVFNPGESFTIAMTCSGRGGQWAYKQVVVEIVYTVMGTNNQYISRASGTIIPYS